jgi:FAD binding domain-containing protein
MNRRSFFRRLAAIPILRILWRGSATSTQAAVKSASSSARRVRPSDPLWPTEQSWNKLNQDVGGRLIRVESPLAACASGSDTTSCQEVIKSLQNPYYIGEEPGATQTSGWLDAWMSAPSVYAVAARSTADVVAAVNFARENNLRLVVTGGGHSYQGTSNAADSLLIWTRAMNSIVLHDAFVGQGCAEGEIPRPAVVTKVTLRTRELPAFFGAVFATIKAASDAAFRRLIGQFVSFYRDSLF